MVFICAAGPHQTQVSDFIAGSGSLESDISCIVNHVVNIVETVWEITWLDN